jgi:hypothetical protein
VTPSTPRALSFFISQITLSISLSVGLAVKATLSSRDTLAVSNSSAASLPSWLLLTIWSAQNHSSKANYTVRIRPWFDDTTFLS